MEVNGGTLSARNSSSFVNQINTLNDGSTLEDAEIRSHANYLTDGNIRWKPRESPRADEWHRYGEGRLLDRRRVES